jgi:N-acetylglucosaminyldiphosphoundecaprenol N-acetyl-beta-D-mannosaminyltransferase
MIQVNLPFCNFKTDSIEGLNNYIFNIIEQNKKVFIPNHNVNSISLLAKSDTLKKIFENEDVIAIDGMPVIWMAKAFDNKIEKSDRATFLDWMPKLWDVADKNNWKVFILGSDEITLETALLNLNSQYKNVSFTGHHGYFQKDNAENDAVLELINKEQPQVLLVGFGMPLQEFWISKNFSRLNTNVILPSGGYLDYLVNDKLIPPRWMGRMGIEWLYRFSKNPKRLFKRYFIEPWPLAISFIYNYCRYKMSGK